MSASAPRIRHGAATPNSRRAVTVTPEQLPLHCPVPGSSLWNSHPRVYIPLENAGDGVALCPYCGTEYRLSRSV